jgi:hypothetical protein
MVRKSPTVANTSVYEPPPGVGHPRRRKGGGSVYFRARDGLWVGAVTLPRASADAPQRRRSVASSLYCNALKKFKDIGDAAGTPVPPANAPRSLTTQARTKATHRHYEWAQLYLDSRGLCFYCGKHANPPEKDHQVPFSRGGSDGIHNIVVSCVECNRAKGSKTADEFLSQTMPPPAGNGIIREMSVSCAERHHLWRTNSTSSARKP